MISADLWQRFGIAPRRQLPFAVSSCVALMCVAVGLAWSGSITPHIRWGINDFFLHADVDGNGVLSTRAWFELENQTITPFTITDISMSIPGLRLLPSEDTEEDPAEITVEGSGSGTVIRRIVIADCAAVPREPQPIRFTYRTWLGSGSSEVTLAPWQLTGSEGQVPVAWQRGLAGLVCNKAVSGDL
ncbi:hypothetical protein SMD20_28950 [Nonomuraea sp. LP-02]|uniref:hypothetical protein n=1 Tax=Nonomuraea sp. LP-02 TaxID=3097960 RepID=UPI002E35499A|nr:hypothetical protein [Nonomuraea sp. LP-02]MED7928317.1 hypothetical protein [Nonomuraea sp. LP-02]